MDISFLINKKIKRYWLYGICLFIIAYFGFHTLCGNRNIYRLFALKHEINQAQAVAGKLNDEKQQLQNLVDHLSDQSLDTDLLDERARVVLNLAADDEFIILTDSLKQ